LFVRTRRAEKAASEEADALYSAFSRPRCGSTCICRAAHMCTYRSVEGKHVCMLICAVKLYANLFLSRQEGIIATRGCGRENVDDISRH